MSWVKTSFTLFDSSPSCRSRNSSRGDNDRHDSWVNSYRALLSGAFGMSPAKPAETRRNPLRELLKVLHGRKLRVLLADDNTNNRDVALWQLDELGCPTDAVTNG